MALTIGVVGCGTAGQAAAILLARQGHQATVFEQAPALSPVGAGLLLQPTGLEVLRSLGVAGELCDLGAEINRLAGFTSTGRSVLDLSYKDLRADLFGLGVQRSALCSELAGQMKIAGVELHLGCKIDSIDRSNTLISATGEAHGPFDLIIVADGARSGLRSRYIKRVRRDRDYSWGALWFMGENPDHGFEDVLHQVYRGTGSMIGFLPSGRAALGDPKQTSMFWSMPTKDWRGADRFDLDAWKSAVRDLTDAADPMLEQIAEPTQLIFAPYRDVILRRTTDGPVVFLGDAAHAMSPQLGQGVNLALLDAAELADQIGHARPLLDSLRVFDRNRRANNAFYQTASRWLTPIFQSNFRVAGPFRDLLLGPACRCRPTRRQMLLSLCGVKTGLVRSVPLPAPSTATPVC